MLARKKLSDDDKLSDDEKLQLLLSVEGYHIRMLEHIKQRREDIEQRLNT